MNKKIAAIVGKVILVVILIFSSLAIIFAAMTSGAMLEVMKKAPKIDANSIKYEMSQNSTIVDEDGNEVNQIASSEYRQIVDYKQIPEDLKNAFVAVEDERFYKHNGVDLLSIIGSALENLKAGSIVRGGSTITQQLARNTYLSNDQTYERKVKEIYLALKIEKNLSKDEILGAYLNRVFMGQNSYGVSAASKTYFNKDVADLNLAQCATLAGVVQSPSENSLYKAIKTSEVTDQRVLGEFSMDGKKYSAIYNETPLDREVYVLDKMLENEYISKSDYDKAKSFDVANSIEPAQRSNIENTSYFYSLLENQVVKKLMELENLSVNQAWDKLYYGGLKITSTMDKQIQNKLEDIYDNFSENLIGNSEGLGYAPLLDLLYDDWGNIINSNSKLLYFKKENFLDENNNVFFNPDQAFYDDEGNLIISSDKVYLDQTRLIFKNYYSLDETNSNLRTHTIGSIDFPSNEDIYLDDDNDIVISKSYLENNESMIIVDENSNISINKDYYDIDLNGVIQPQSSSVVIDQKSGQIKAIMGGRDQEGISILNRASSLPRQPGSSIKPLATYTPALDNGFNLASGIDDVPFMKDENDKPWPVNVYGYYMGLTSLRDSLKMSINTAAVSTLNKVGIETSKKYLKNFGLIKENGDDDYFVSKDENSETNDENLAALGVGAMSHGFTNLDMTAAYASLANGGEYIEPLTFSKIVDNNDNVIFDDSKIKKATVTSDQTAYQMTSALESAGEYYENIYLNDTEFATKTGTTDDKVDFWCMGYTPYYTVGFWMGADDQNFNLNSNSVDRAALMWGIINNKILEDKESKSFIEPKGIKHLEVDTMSGKLPTDISRADPRGTVIEEIFGENNYPKKEDDVHVWATIDTRNNLLASNVTPEFLMATRSFISPKDNYDPNKFDGIKPQDWDYRVPTIYSDLIYVPPKEEPKVDKDKDKDKKKDKDKDVDKENNKESGNDTNKLDDLLDYYKEGLSNLEESLKNKNQQP